MAVPSSNGTRTPRSPRAARVETGAGSGPPITDADVAAAERLGRQMLAENPTLCVFFETIGQVIQDAEFKRSTLRFLLILFVEVEPGNFLTGWSAHGLSRKYAMDYASALDALKLLIRKDWLRQLDNGTGVQRYRLSPHLCWRGRPWKARIAQKNWDAEAQLARLAQTWERESS